MMPTSRQKKEAKLTGVSPPWSHEWSGNIYTKGTLTREGGFKTWQEAERWVKWKIKEEKDLKVPTITLGVVCHVERNNKGKLEDVDVIRFMPTAVVGMDGIQWIRVERKKPWFEGHYN